MADGLSLPDAEPLDPAAVASAIDPDRPRSAPPPFDPSKPYTVLGADTAPPFDPSKPFKVLGEQPSVMDRAKDFVKGSASDVVEDVKNLGKRAYEGAQESTADFTTPIDTESWTPHASGLAGELLEPFAPSIGVAGATAARAVKTGMDLISPAVGAASGLIENPVGKPGAAAVRAVADKVAPNSAAAEMSPEEFAGDVVNVGLMAAGGEHAPAAAHSPVVEGLATPTVDRVEGVPPPAPVTEADLVNPEAARATPQPVAEQPARTAAPAPAPEPTPQPPPASAPPPYSPQFDLETNTYHVAGPDGQRVQYDGKDLAYNRPEDAATHADIMNQSRPAPPLEPQKTAASTELSPQDTLVSAPPDLTRQIQVGDETRTVNLPDENHAALFDYGTAVERAQDGAPDENLNASDIYSRFKPWVHDDFRNVGDVNSLAEDYLYELRDSRPDKNGVIQGHVVVDPSLEANYVREQRGIAPVRISTPPESVEPVEGQIVNVDPKDLNLDPARFQYKASDDKGVTGDLSAVKQWEPALTNPITAWRDTDGDLYVVNGHQRTDLALRAQDAGQPDVQMPARIYNEADGYTPEYMRALGAIQNMAEGSGTAIDAAKVLRALPDLPEGKTLPMSGLNIARGVAKDAQGLAALTDHGFGLVTNEVLPAQYAAEVGRRITDPTEQNAALDKLVKAKPNNAAQAKFMVDDMINGGFLHGEQTSLFGTEQLAQSLMSERSQILDNSIRTLRRNKSVFNAAVSGEDTLSGAGNVLDREGNLKGKTDNEQLIEHLGGATKKGPLSDALSQSARDLAAGKTTARATSDFLAKARQIVKSGYAEEGIQSGDHIGGDRPARQGEAGPVEEAAYRPTEADGQNAFFEHGPMIERTDQGDQYVMPGAERTAAQAAAARGETMAGKVPQKPADMGMFAPRETPQPNLFDRPAVEPAKINPHQEAADYVSQKGHETGNEHLAAVDGKTGEIFGHSSSGEKSRITVPQDIVERMNDPNENIVLHHNHPSGTALSPSDIGNLMFPGMDSIVAHSHDGVMSAASLTPEAKAILRGSVGPEFAEQKFMSGVKAAYRGSMDVAQQAYDAGRVSAAAVNQAITEMTMRALHEIGALDYTTSRDISDVPADVQEDMLARASFLARDQLKEIGLGSSSRDVPAAVRTEEGLARLPGADGEGIPGREQAEGRGNSDVGSSAGSRNAGEGAGGQYRLLENTRSAELHEAPEVKELFDRAAATLESSKSPLRGPSRLAATIGHTISDTVVGRLTRRLVTPGAFDDTARVAARGIRQVFGQMYVKDMQAAHALKSASDLLDKMDTDGKNEFAMAYEEGRPQATPELTKIANGLRQVTAEATRRLQSLGLLEDAKQNYLGRIWKERGKDVDNSTSDKVLAALANKKPLTGSKSFLKERYYDTYRDALDAGLEPQFSNPIMTQLVKISEMNRFYAGTLVQRGAKTSGISKFFSHPGDVPDGFMPLEGHEFKRTAMQIKSEDGDSTHVPEGRWYAPEGFARVMNNFVSPGLKATMFKEPVAYLRAAANAMNSFQLGLSFFHPMFTSLDAMASRIGIGVRQAMPEFAGGSGDLIKGGKNIAGGLSPSNWVTNMMDGDKLIKSILDPDNATPEQQRLVNAFGASGGRVFMQRVLAPTDEGAIKVWKKGAIGQAVRDANAKYPESPVKKWLNVTGRMLETTSAPIMDYIVPRQKLGVFSRLGQDWLDSHPNATNTEFVAGMQSMWDSVDNRLGQMVYDNLFWDKTLKDIAFVTTRSVGWNLGSLREIGGAVGDFGKYALDAASLQKPEFTQRMGYLMGLVMLHTTMAAMIQYMFTGQGPQEFKDYFYPKTGLMRPDGTPDRMTLPTYMKDIFAYAHDPVSTIANKESPLLSFIGELYSGKDYYGDLIANKDDPMLKQIGDVLKFTASQFQPFSIQGTKRLFEERPGPQAVMGMFGFSPAPGYIANPAIGKKFEDRQHKADVKKTEKRQARQNIVQPLKPMPPQAHAAGGRVMDRDAHDRAAGMADPNPTHPQIKAGNYKKGHLRIHGIDVSIETAKGQVRRGVGKDGKPWQIRMVNHYGYFRRSVGADGAQVDCFVGFFPNAKHVYVIDQVDPDTRKFDETKVMTHFPNLTTAVSAYRRAFSDGKGMRRIGNIRSMTIAEFKDWLRDGDTKRSIAA